MDASNPYAPPEAKVADIPEGEVAPPLWNPAASTAWCLLFSPIFGAILQMKNWQALGEYAKAATSRHWAVGSAIFVVVVMIASFVLPQTPGIDRALNLSGFIMLLVWYFANGREQIGYVKARFGKTYPRKRWGIPLLVGFVCLMALFVAVVVIAIATIAATGQY